MTDKQTFKEFLESDASEFNKSIMSDKDSQPPFEMETIGDVIGYLLCMNGGTFIVKNIGHFKQGKLYREGLTLNEALMLVNLGGVIKGYEKAEGLDYKETIDYYIKNFVTKFILAKATSKNTLIN